MSHVIGLDIGTSGIKAGAMDRHGRLSFMEREAYHLSFPQPGWVEIDPEEIWEKSARLIRQIAKQIEEQGGNIDGLSLSCFCNASIFIDHHGTPIGPGIMYMDQRSVEEVQAMREAVAPDEHFRITKNRVEPGVYSVSTLLWVKNKRPDVFSKTYKWGHLSSYILYKLTGEFVMDWTQASFTGLYDIIHYEWSERLLQAYEIESSILPDVVDPVEPIGHVSSAAELGFEDIPVAAGGADTACSTLALGIGPNQMFESVGTSDVLTVCSDQADLFDPRFMNRCHILKNRWLSHGPMSTAGASIRWYYETFLQDQGSVDSLLEELPGLSEPGAHGVFFLPYMFGERAPIWDYEARGVFAGLHLGTNRADMLQAIFEGCSFGLRQIYEIIEETYPFSFSRFTAIGGGAKNRHWTQIKANVLGKTIEVKEVGETAVFGSCLLAGKAAGYFTTLEEGIQGLQNETLCTVEPDPDLKRLYDVLYQDFLALYPAMKPFFKRRREL